jgi:hypothetical protein
MAVRMQRTQQRLPRSSREWLSSTTARQKVVSQRCSSVFVKISVEDVWQLHRSEAAGGDNFADDRIANLDERTAHWIKLCANDDGSFRVMNGRTGVWKTYGAR